MTRRSRRDVSHPWRWLVLGSAAVVAGLALSWGSVDAWRESGRYRDAPACDETRTRHCVVETTAVVDGTLLRRRRTDTHRVFLRFDRPELVDPRPAATVDLADPDVVFDALTPGQRVRVRLWERRVARIGVPGVGSAETEDSPLVRSLEGTVGGLLFLTLGASAIWFADDLRRHGGWRRVEVSPVPATPGVRGDVGRALGAALVGEIVALLRVSFFDHYSASSLLAVPLVAVPLWLLLRRRARRAH